MYHAYHAQVVVRGNRVTFVHQADEEAIQRNGPHIGISPLSKWTNADGGYCEIVYDGFSAEMLRMPAGPYNDVVQRQRTYLEFAFGFGFGQLRVFRLRPGGGTLRGLGRKLADVVWLD